MTILSIGMNEGVPGALVTAPSLICSCTSCRIRDTSVLLYHPFLENGSANPMLEVGARGGDHDAIHIELVFIVDFVISRVKPVLGFHDPLAKLIRLEMRAAYDDFLQCLLLPGSMRQVCGQDRSDKDKKTCAGKLHRDVSTADASRTFSSSPTRAATLTRGAQKKRRTLSSPPFPVKPDLRSA
jgi:hypothetical protein